MTLNENPDYPKDDQEQWENEIRPPPRRTEPEDTPHNKEREGYKDKWANEKCRAIKIPRRQKIDATCKGAAHEHEQETDRAMSEHRHDSFLLACDWYANETCGKFLLRAIAATYSVSVSSLLQNLRLSLGSISDRASVSRPPAQRVAL